MVRSYSVRRSEALQFTKYQWSWLSSFLSSSGSPPCNVALSRRSKRLLVRPTAVYANSIQSGCSLIRCETAAQLKAVNLLFGNCCLVGLLDPPPSVNNSVLLRTSTCNVIIPNDSIEYPFILNTSRLDLVLILSATEYA